MPDRASVTGSRLASLGRRGYWKLLMLKNTLGITLRSLMKNKVIFLIKVFGLADFLAVPLAWMATTLWLQGFAYSIQPGFPVFAFAFLAMFAIAMVAVLLQAPRSARDNPVDALRCE